MSDEEVIRFELGNISSSGGFADGKSSGLYEDDPSSILKDQCTENFPSTLQEGKYSQMVGNKPETSDVVVDQGGEYLSEQDENDCESMESLESLETNTSGANVKFSRQYGDNFISLPRYQGNMNSSPTVLEEWRRESGNCLSDDSDESESNFKSMDTFQLQCGKYPRTHGNMNSSIRKHQSSKKVTFNNLEKLSSKGFQRNKFAEDVSLQGHWDIEDDSFIIQGDKNFADNSLSMPQFRRIEDIATRRKEDHNVKVANGAERSAGVEDPDEHNPTYPFSFDRDQPNRSPVKVSKIVLQSIQHLRKKNGATCRQIKKYLFENTDVSVRQLDGEIKEFLKQASDNGVLKKHSGGRYTIEKERPEETVVNTQTKKSSPYIKSLVESLSRIPPLDPTGTSTPGTSGSCSRTQLPWKRKRDFEAEGAEAAAFLQEKMTTVYSWMD